MHFDGLDKHNDGLAGAVMQGEFSQWMKEAYMSCIHVSEWRVVLSKKWSLFSVNELFYFVLEDRRRRREAGLICLRHSLLAESKYFLERPYCPLSCLGSERIRYCSKTYEGRCVSHVSGFEFRVSCLYHSVVPRTYVRTYTIRGHTYVEGTGLTSL